MGIGEVSEKEKDQSQGMEEDYLGKREQVHSEGKSLVGDRGGCSGNDEVWTEEGRVS